MMPAGRPRGGPNGRPTAIDRVIGEHDGHPITVFDRIVGLIENNAYYESAFAAAGVPIDTGRGWLRTGAKVLIKIGDCPVDDAPGLTDLERRCAHFSTAVRQAEGRADVAATLDVQKLARGGVLEQVTTIKVDADGNEIERTIKSTYTLPDLRAIQWLQKHGPYRDRYADRVELTGAEGGPIELSQAERATALLEQVRAHRAHGTVATAT